MNKNKLTLLTIILIAGLLLSCGEQKETSNEEVKKDSEMSKSELVREGVIDVKAIDLNNDGKVFECPMDWDVIGDTSGVCPTCGMDLKEYTIAAVKTNLDEHGYEFVE